MTEPLSANVIVCTEVLAETEANLLSAIRMMSVITVATVNTHAIFYSVVFVSSIPGDQEQHVMRVAMRRDDGQVVLFAPDHLFKYGYQVDINGYGGFSLRTRFDVDMTKLETSGTYWIWVYVDENPVAKTPIMLRR
jgi:hypothetical protein